MSALDVLVAEYIAEKGFLDERLREEEARSALFQLAIAARTEATAARVAQQERLMETKAAIEAIQRRDDIADDVVERLIGA